jgi:Bacteriophage tail sheath protein
MSISLTYPGVYIQELPSPVHTIAGVPTSIAAFVGYTPRGIDNRAQAIFSFADFERLYGGLASNSELSYAVQQFYLNAPGSQAYVVRVGYDLATFASVTFDTVTFTALSSGSWANGQLYIDVDLQNGVNATDTLAFNLTITDLVDQTTEYFPAVTADSTAQNYVATVVNDPANGSQLVNMTGPLLAAAPTVTGVLGSPIAIGGAGGVNDQLGGSPTATKANADYTIILDTTQPPSAAPLPITVTVIANNSPIPQSLTSLAAQLQQTMNQVLATSFPGASVQCSVQPSATGQGICVNALLPQQPDAVVSLTGTAAAAFGFTAPTSSNVAHYALGTGHAYVAGVTSTPATNGASPPALPTTADIIGDPNAFTGIYALLKVDLFNLLSIPDATRALPSDPSAQDPSIKPVDIYTLAIALCDQKRAFLLVDPPPNITTVSGAIDWKSTILGITDQNGAAFWPRVRLADPLQKFNLRTFAPSGVVAGVYATTDGSRGVWKAPAGIQASLQGVQALTYPMSDQENGLLNPLGLNCFRTFPVYGMVLWGARTLQGADAFASQWKYVPVRRTALFLEESLYRGTKWVVFEPNDERLWAAIRLNVTSFMQSYFLKGAFQGLTPDQAYFVKCDSETTTPTDVNNGVVNILVGFAPLKPAEFVVIQIEQLTGQASS